MKSSLLKRSLIAGAVVATSVATFIPTISAASATTVIAAGGSDTTENVMGSILSQLNTDSVPTYNIPVYSSSAFTVPADDYCPSVTYSPQGTTGLTYPNQVAPNGSGAGRSLLASFVSSTKRFSGGVEVASSSDAYATATPVTGCLDIARSSSYGSGSPKATVGQYYAFAIDAVSWASPSTKAPSTLTLDQLGKIYNCTYTNWSQVGGQDGSIQRYLPQSGSGTRDYFVTDLLGLSKTATFTSNADCPAVKVTDKFGNPFEENRGDRIPDSDLETAILAYSAGQWSYQANNAVNPSIDQRKSSGGVVTMIKGIDNHKGDSAEWNSSAIAWNTIDGRYQTNDAGWANIDPTPDAGGYPVIESNTTQAGATGYNSWNTVRYPGVRLVYNVIDTESPSYLTARGLVGFNNVDGGSKSLLCSGAFKTTIAAFGFAPMTSTANQTSNVAGSTCRRYLA